MNENIRPKIVECEDGTIQFIVNEKIILELGFNDFYQETIITYVNYDQNKVRTVILNGFEKISSE